MDVRFAALEERSGSMGLTVGERVQLDPRSLTVCVILVLAPISRVLSVVDDREGRDYAQHTIVFAVDVALLVLTIQQVRRIPRMIVAWRRHPTAIAATALAVLLLPAFLVHPTDRGVAAILRLVGVAAMAAAISDVSQQELKLIRWTAAAVLALSGVVAVAQRALGRAVGLGTLGENSDGVVHIGSGVAPFGLFVHPYVAAAWAAVAGLGLLAVLVRMHSVRAVAVGALLLGLAPIGLSLGRSAVLAAVLGGLGLLVGIALAPRPERGRALALTGATAAVILLTVVWNLGGWVSRADDTLRSGDPTARRDTLFQQASGLLRSDPAFGVGPGNYVLALHERPDLVALNPQSPRPVHNVPYLLVVEGGLVALPAVVALGCVATLQAWRSRAVGLVLLGAFAPFLLLDHLAWSFPQGLVLTGLWLGLLDWSASGVSEQPAAPA